MKTLCIYHANCADGFGAAWVVRQALGKDNVDFHASHHGDVAPDVEGRDVIIVDFSYPHALLCLLGHQARSILIIDHHKSAAEDLAQLQPAPATYSEWLDSDQRVGTVFDMERSGAGLTWDYITGNQPRPALINHIEDRDLWRFNMECTREVQANLFSYPYDFDVWDALMQQPIMASIAAGTAIERKHHKDVAELVAASKRRMLIAGINVPVANLPYTLSSDAGHLMGVGEPFAACYMDTPRGRVFSLRSAETGLDVSEIAKQYGGGGHRNAAGFKVPLDHELATGITPGARVLTCACCGAEYPQDTPSTGNQVLLDHIRICPEHPMRTVEHALHKLRTALAGLVGASTLQELEQLEVGLQLVPVPATEKATMTTAIQALRETAPSAEEAQA